MDQILEQVDGAVEITDDVTIYGKLEEYHKIFHEFIQTAKYNCLVFNSAKCKIKSKSISFFGMIYNENGVSPDLEKINDLWNISSPTMQEKITKILRSSYQYLH